MSCHGSVLIYDPCLKELSSGLVYPEQSSWSQQGEKAVIQVVRIWIFAASVINIFKDVLPFGTISNPPHTFHRRLQTDTCSLSDIYCAFYFQAPVLWASCHVKMAGVSLRGRTVTSQTTVAMAQMKRIVGLPAPLRTVAVAGRAPSLIILIGR